MATTCWENLQWKGTTLAECGRVLALIPPLTCLGGRLDGLLTFLWELFCQTAQYDAQNIHSSRAIYSAAVLYFLLQVVPLKPRVCALYPHLIRSRKLHRVELYFTNLLLLLHHLCCWVPFFALEVQTASWCLLLLRYARQRCRFHPAGNMSHRYRPDPVTSSCKYTTEGSFENIDLTRKTASALVCAAWRSASDDMSVPKSISTTTDYALLRFSD